MIWAIIGTIAGIVTIINVLPEVPGLIESWQSEDNDIAESKRLQAEQSLIEAKDRRNKTVWRGIIVLTSILTAGITLYKIFFSGKKSQRYRKLKKK